MLWHVHNFIVIGCSEVEFQLNKISTGFELQVKND